MPLWEDPENCEGGRVTLTLTGRELLPFLWETLVCFCLDSDQVVELTYLQLLTTIGEQFNVGREICGISVTYKSNRDQAVLCVWNKTATFTRVISQIEYEEG